MTELEIRLRALREEAAWPETPDLAAAVAAAIAAGRAVPAAGGTAGRVAGGGAAGRVAGDGAAGRTAGEGAAARGAAGRRAAKRGVWRGRSPDRAGGRRRVVVGVAAALVVLIPAGAAAAFPQARDDVLEWLGLRRTEVRRSAQPPPARAPAGSDLGARVSFEAAARRAGFRPLVPAGLGPPDAVHVAELGATARTTLVYRPRPGLPSLDGVRAGLLVTQVQGDLNGDLLLKIAGPGTGVRRIRIGGRPAVLFSGASHVYLYLDPSGQVVEDRPWRAGTTLVLERGDAVIRLEAATGATDLRRLAGWLRLSPARGP
jgi:hypothetical protein